MKSKIIRVMLALLLLAMIFENTSIVRADEGETEANADATQTAEQNEPTQETEIADDTEGQNEQASNETIKAKVIEAGDVYLRDNGNGGQETVQDIKIKILNGDKKDEKFDSTYVLTYDIDNKVVGSKLREGATLFVKITEENGEVKVDIQDIVRQNYLLVLVLFFFASIILVGKKKGVKAILGLIVTVFAVFFIMLTTIFKGYNAILVSIGTCFLVTVLTFTIIGGWNKKTVSAALGTIGGVIFAGLLATLIGYFANLSGAGKEEAIMLSVASKNVTFNFRELLFAEIIVSALGACMDVGMSIASSLSELKEKKPSMTAKELFKSGMNIGGDMIGTMTNTLILSFIGSSLLLILLYMSSSVTFLDVINIEAIASEAVCAISGSVGIVYTVPITAALFALINRDKESYKKQSDNIVEGKRSLKI